MRVVKERANAKINLHLDVISRRDDGFHDIQTVMHSVSLADELTVTYTPSNETNVKMHINGNKFLPTDDKNLAVRAATCYLNAACKTANIDIKLNKKIPVSAGLAGGSSDAAATLRAMNRLFGKMFSESALFEMAAALGSDVPYCLYGKTALCEGRGEIITKLPDTLKLCLVVAISNERVSTPSAYSTLDEIYSYFDGSVKTGGDTYFSGLISSIKGGGLVPEKLFNVFEMAIFPKCPGAKSIKEKLLSLGARCALMSGSGPSVFGVFKSIEEAERARISLLSEGISAYTATTV